MTHMLSGLAGGRLVVALEVLTPFSFVSPSVSQSLKLFPQGGYNIEATAQSSLAVTKILLGEPPEELPPLVATDAGSEVVWLVAREQSKYWKSLDPKALEPRAGTKYTYSFFLFSI